MTNRIVLLAAVLVVPSPAVAQERFVLNRDTVVCHDANGKVVWSRHFEQGVGGVRPPHLQWDNERVYFTYPDGIMALDGRNGELAWQAKGSSARLLLNDGLLLATDCFADQNVPHWFVGREVAKGTEVFKVRLPADLYDPLPIQEMAGVFVVQSGEAPGGNGHTLVFDRTGNIQHRFYRQVIDGRRVENDVVFLTSTDVERVSADGKTSWTIRFGSHQWIAGGGFADLDNGDLIAFRYGCISDSGVDLVLFNPTNGTIRWRTHCPRLDVGHSKYFHEASVVVKDETILVTSNGASGTFVETLDLERGWRLERDGEKLFMGHVHDYVGYLFLFVACSVAALLAVLAKWRVQCMSRKKAK